MPYGFSGQAATGYLERATEAIAVAGAAHSRDPYSGYAGSIAFPAALPVRGEGGMPSPDSGGAGHMTGTGSQSNIVVSQSIYEEVLQRFSSIDAAMEEELSKAAQQVREMYTTVYTLPRTLPGVQRIEGGVEASFTEFYSLTNDTRSRALGFLEEIVSIR